MAFDSGYKSIGIEDPITLVGGTASSTVYSAPWTALTVAGSLFTAANEGEYVYFTTTGNSYQIVNRDSATVVQLAGNASAESGAFKISSTYRVPADAEAITLKPVGDDIEVRIAQGSSRLYPVNDEVTLNFKSPMSNSANKVFDGQDLIFLGPNDTVVYMLVTFP